VLSAIVTRKASRAFFVLAPQEPLLTLKLISSNLGFPLTLQAFVIQNSPLDCFVARRATIPHPTQPSFKTSCLFGAAFFIA
jgi:hypothetical protein